MTRDQIEKSVADIRKDLEHINNAVRELNEQEGIEATITFETTQGGFSREEFLSLKVLEVL